MAGKETAGAGVCGLAEPLGQSLSSQDLSLASSPHQNYPVKRRDLINKIAKEAKRQGIA